MPMQNIEPWKMESVSRLARSGFREARLGLRTDDTGDHDVY
jgi:hypothetical protein